MRRSLIALCCLLVLVSGCSAKNKVVDVNERGCEVLDVSTLKVYDRFFNYSLDLGFDTVISLTAYTDLIDNKEIDIYFHKLNFGDE